MSISIFSFLFRGESPDYAFLEALNRKTNVSIFLDIFSMTAILDLIITNWNAFAMQLRPNL